MTSFQEHDLSILEFLRRFFRHFLLELETLTFERKKFAGIFFEAERRLALRKMSDVSVQGMPGTSVDYVDMADVVR
jgi:hypothetical protein